MKITDLIVEQQNIDEVSMAQVGQTAGKIIGGTGKAIGGAIGATAGGIKQFGKGFMSGLKGGYSSVGGTTGTSTATTTDTTGGAATTSAAPSGSTAPAASTTAAPAASTTAAPAASTTPASASTTNVDDIIAQIGTLSPTQKATLKTELDKVGIKATPAPTPPTTKRKKPRAKNPKPFVPGASTGAGDIGIMENKFYSKFLDQKI